MRSLATLRFFGIMVWLMGFASLFIARSATVDEKAQELATRARAILKAHCYSCHGDNGVAKKNVYVLNHSRLLSSKLIVPSDANSPLLKVIDSGSMPLGGPELSKEEKSTLRSWVLAGAPSWEEADKTKEAREFIAETEILRAIQEDLTKSRERTRAFQRYFSIAHLYNGGANEKELETCRIALAKLLNSLSWHKEIALPIPVNPSKTILRVDLRDYQWTAASWNVLLQTYPYAFRTQDSEIIRLLSGADSPYLRADWFIASASVPPLYHELLGLPQTLQELERMLGINVARNLEEEKNVARAGIRTSGVSQNNRVLERHVSPYGAYWKSLDFRNNLGAQNIFRNPLHLTAAGGEVIFNLPNGLQAYFLADGSGRRLDEAPIDIVADRNNPDEPVIRNGRSCMSCHAEGMKPIRDDVRSVVREMSLSFSEQERALALYLPQADLDTLIDKDRLRFREAMLQINSSITNNPNTEPVFLATRRFHNELTPEQAASEAGLEWREFVNRAQRSARLGDLGFRQVLVTNGGIKRDLWERHFSEVVRELGIGQPIVRQRLAGNSRPWPGERLADGKIANRAIERIGAFDNSPDRILKSARLVSIKSRTMFLKSDMMANELRKHHEFRLLGLEITEEEKQADIQIELDRPPFTFIYQYMVIQPATKVLLLRGKITAFDGSVASPKIAREILNRLQTARAPISR